MPHTWSAVILAGGLGSRLNPLTAEICKPMVSVANRPMIDYAIDHLRYAGISKIIICVKKFGDELRNQIHTTWTEDLQKKLGLEIIVPKNDSKGTADAVRMVAKHIDSDHVVISMADIITSLDMKAMMEYHIQKDAQSTVSMKRIEEMATKYGNTMLADDGRIIRFLEKPSSEEIYLSALTGGGTESLPIINTGIYCFKKEIIDFLGTTDMMDFGKHVFPYLKENEYRLYGFLPQSNYYWLDVGNPTTYLWSNWDMLRLYGFPITPKGVRQGESHIWYLEDEKPSSNLSHGTYICLGKNNQYGTGNFIKELTSIGSNCQFANHVSIDRSVIWDNVKLGNGVKVEQSVIANNVKIADHCIIRSNTVIGPNCKILKPNTILDNQILSQNTIIE